MIDTKPLSEAAAPPAFARWISAAARAQFARIRDQPAPIDTTTEGLRTYYDGINSARFDRAVAQYAVAISQEKLAGVDVHRVEPSTGPSAPAVLLCLHGGAFVWGSGAGAVLEAVPMAATTGLAVLAVEYRLAPEHRYPCAVEDVLAVLRHIRRSTPGCKVGIYGCSAGAVLTAQVVARLIDAGEALPEAIVMLHACGLDIDGDSLALTTQLNGAPGAAEINRLHDLDYFAGTNPGDPLIFPGEHAHMLERFPPSLLITGTRDFAASSVSVMHRRLRAAGRVAELALFDGMWHAHHVDVDLPESEETARLMADFFGQHLL